MKSQILMFQQQLLTEVGGWCGVSTHRDLNRITSRFEHEGLPFLTVTLPEFGKAFERSLDRGFTQMSDFPGYPAYRKDGQSGVVPMFLSGFTGQVFDLMTGVLLDAPNVIAIRAIRQLTFAFSKVETDISEEKKVLALENYIEVDRQVGSWNARFLVQEISYLVFLMTRFHSSNAHPPRFGVHFSHVLIKQYMRECIFQSMDLDQPQMGLEETLSTGRRSGLIVWNTTSRLGSTYIQRSALA